MTKTPDKVMAEIRKMKQLLKNILPEMESRLEGLIKLWPSREVLTVIHRNETLIEEIKKFIPDQK